MGSGWPRRRLVLYRVRVRVRVRVRLFLSSIGIGGMLPSTTPMLPCASTPVVRGQCGGVNDVNDAAAAVGCAASDSVGDVCVAPCARTTDLRRT